MKTQYLVSFLIIRIFNAIANIISFLHNFIYLYAFTMTADDTPTRLPVS